MDKAFLQGFLIFALGFGVITTFAVALLILIASIASGTLPSS